MLVKSNLTGRIVEVKENLGKLLIVKGKAVAVEEFKTETEAKPKAKPKTKK